MERGKGGGGGGGGKCQRMQGLHYCVASADKAISSQGQQLTLPARGIFVVRILFVLPPLLSSSLLLPTVYENLKLR